MSVRLTPYHLVAFDFDGTLADSFPWFGRIFQELAREFHFKPLTNEEYERARGLDTPAFMKLLGVPLWKMPKVIARVRELALRDHRGIPLFPKTVWMLAKLRGAGLQVAIVSSNSEEVIRNVLGPETSAVIDHFACGASLLGKASKLRRVVRRAKVPAADAIYVGDELRDAVAARQTGMAFGAVAWGYASFEALLRERPERAFQTMEELVATLCSGES
jgi:phosphoglycolate phosphatase